MEDKAADDKQAGWIAPVLLHRGGCVDARDDIQASSTPRSSAVHAEACTPPVPLLYVYSKVTHTCACHGTCATCRLAHPATAARSDDSQLHADVAPHDHVGQAIRQAPYRQHSTDAGMHSA
jgi:hypothetical protein